MEKYRATRRSLRIQTFPALTWTQRGKITAGGIEISTKIPTKTLTKIPTKILQTAWTVDHGSVKSILLFITPVSGTVN